LLPLLLRSHPMTDYEKHVLSLLACILGGLQFVADDVTKHLPGEGREAFRKWKEQTARALESVVEATKK
jgi:hypothetical protein